MQSISIVFLLIDLYKEPVEKSSLHFRDLMYSLKIKCYYYNRGALQHPYSSFSNDY